MESHVPRCSSIRQLYSTGSNSNPLAGAGQWVGEGGWLQYPGTAASTASPHRAHKNDVLSDLFSPTLPWHDVNIDNTSDGPASNHPMPHHPTTTPHSASSSVLRPQAPSFSPQTSQIQTSSEAFQQAYTRGGWNGGFMQDFSGYTAGRPYYTVPDAGPYGHSLNTGGFGNTVPNFETAGDGTGNATEISTYQTTMPSCGAGGDWSLGSCPKQQLLYPTPPWTANTTRQGPTTRMQTMTLHEGVQTVSQFLSPPVTDRMIEEAGTSADPTRVARNLQRLNLPPNVSPTTSQRRTVSQNGSRHSCSHRNCRRIFDTRSELSHHQRSHAPTEERPLGCELCGVRFLYPKDLNRHFRSQSHRSKARTDDGQNSHASASFHCPVTHCRFHRRGFPRRDNCVRHIQIHGGLENAEPIIIVAPPSVNSSSS